MKLYDQTKQRETTYSCTIYSILNMLKFDFCVKIEDDMILKLVAYMESIGKLLPKGAVFDIIYPAVISFVNLRYGIKLKVEKGLISKGLDTTHSWSLGIKGFSVAGLKKGTDDGVMSKDDIDWILKNIKNGSGHNHIIKKQKSNNNWVLIDSWGGVGYKMDLEVLKYAMEKGLYYDTARRIVPDNDFTKRLKIECLNKYKELGRVLTLEEFEELKQLLK